MKKFMAIFICVVLSVQCTLALSGDATVSVRNELAYGQIDVLVRTNNDNIKLNELSYTMIENPPGADMYQSAMFENVQRLSALNSDLQNAIQNTTDSDTIIALKATSANLSATIGSLSSQMYQMNSSQDKIDQARDQFDTVADQMVMGTQSLYTAHDSMNIQMKQLKLNLKSLKDSVGVLEKRYSLGQISELDLLGAKHGIFTLESAIVGLEYEMNNIKSQINIMIGQDYDTELILFGLDVPDEEYIANIDLGKDKSIAIENSKTLRIKRKAMDSARSSYYRNTNDKGLKASYQAASMQYDMEIKNINSSVDKLHRAVLEKQRLYKVEKQNLLSQQKQFTSTQLKYKLGTISQAEYNSVLYEIEGINIKIDVARSNLFTAIEQYKWALKGILSN